MKAGVICFVGLGPGDPRLLTERAAERLANADAILAGGQGSLEQAIAFAREGKRVVRTTPFDPFESADAVAEMRDAASAGVAIEVVPGITASSSCAAFAGIVGGAVHMSQGTLRTAFASEPPDQPVALIENAGSPSQRVIVTTASDAASRANDWAGTILAAQRLPDAKLRWFEERPLFGKRILVTRAREQAGSTAALLREHGGEPIVIPTIEIHPPSDPQPLLRAIATLGQGGYAWVVFTSANGVDRMWETLAAHGADARAFGAARLAAIGPATAAALERHGLRADVVAKEYRGEGLADALLEAITHSSATQILLARAARARDVLPETLRAAGHTVDVVAAYETHPPSPQTVDTLASALKVGQLDAATFTSSSTVDNLCDLLGDRAADLLSRVRVASIGPITTATAVSRGLRIDVTAREYTVSGLVQALADSYG